jgi:tRNA modification GTPase
VEEIGVQRARERIAQADIVILVVDGAQEPDPEDLRLYQEVKARPHLVAINKIDIASQEILRLWQELFPESEKVFISAKEHRGLEALAEKIFEIVVGRQEASLPSVVPNLRQKMALEAVRSSLETAIAQLRSPNVLPELVAVDLREALSHLGEITGEATQEELLNQIFSNFCLGK